MFSYLACRVRSGSGVGPVQSESEVGPGPCNCFFLNINKEISGQEPDQGR